MSTKEIKICEYYFSPISPWSYLGHERLVNLAQKYDVKIDIKPLDIVQLFGASGGIPLAKRAPQRQAYRLQELKRWSDFLQIPLHVQPTFFPVSGDLASKLILATQLAHGTQCAMQLAFSTMQAVWADEQNIAEAATLINLANQLDLDGNALIKSAEVTSIHNQYQQNTQQAIAANVFGTPWYVYKGEAFWGQDRLDFLERAFAA